MNDAAAILTAQRATAADGLPDMPVPETHPVAVAVTDAISALLAFMPTKVIGEPRMDDAKMLIRDLETMCKIVDPLIRSIGEYASSTLGVSQADVDRYFTDQLLGALDGNATFALTNTMRKRIESYADA